MADKGAVKDHARRVYAEIDTPWPATNGWSVHTHRSIGELLAKFVTPFVRPNCRLLNVGSHGNTYGLETDFHCHTDIVFEPIRSGPIACVADAEAMPFRGESFDLVLCVGSVINYCSAAEAIRELSRVTKPGGYVVLEFETSNSFEFLLSPDFSRDAAIVETFYNGNKEKLYVYAKRYIEAALRANDLTPVARQSFHLITPLAYRLFGREQWASKFGALDDWARRLPFFRNLSANVFVMAQKI